MEFSKTEEGFMVGKYVVPVPGTYFVEIIVLSCWKLYQNTSFSLVMDSCIEDTRRHRITAPNASIEISRWSPHPEHKLGFWTLKPGVQAHPLRTRVQPNGCVLPLCDLSEFVTNNVPLDDYTFEYQAGREGPSGSSDGFEVKDSGSVDKINRKLCFIGASHARATVEMLNNVNIIHVDTKWPRELTLAGYTSLDNNCSHAVIGIGQWPAGWPELKPMAFSAYREEMREGMINFTNIVNGSMMTMVRSEHENPLGNVISSCPPRDWRNPEVVRIYNEILAELCRDLRIPFLDTTSIISPLWDTADDWCHYTNQVGLEEATYLAHSLSYL